MNKVVDERLSKAEELMEQEQWVKARGLYHELLLEDPTNSYLLLQLGIANYRQGKEAEAMTYLEKSLELDADNADAHLFLGLLYEREKQLDAAEEQFKATLQLVGDYKDAEEGLERIAKARRGEEDKGPKFSVWQEMMVERAEKAEDVKEYITASRSWYELYDDDPTNPFFTYRLGQVLGWMSRHHEAIYFLKKTLDLQGDHTDAMLRLGFQEMAIGHHKVAEALFNKILAIDGERVDALDGLTRSLFLQGRFCSAKDAGKRRFADGDPDYFIYKLYHRVIDRTNPSTKGFLVYVQERETDLITKLVTAQRNTFVSQIEGKIPVTERMTIGGSFQAGTTRERNLVNGTNNLFVPGNIVNGYINWLPHSKVSLSASCGVEHGTDTGDPNFKVGHETRLQPAGSISYDNTWQSYTFVGYADSLLIKIFGTNRATLLPRETYQLSGQWSLFQSRITFNARGYLRYYHDFDDNREYDTMIWAESGYPRFGPVVFLRYHARDAGFKTNEVNYNSYKRQWEHAVYCFFVRDTVLNTEVELVYYHAWQWSRKLNQPVNTVVFVNKLFRNIDKVYLELRQLYRPNIRGTFRSDYYFDSTNYKAWSVKGSLNLTF